ncbi:MAG: alanine--tRNA ligase [Campylobacterales bacterium]
MDIRAEFLNYFGKNNHTIYESMPLVPDDPSLLFTNAGMVQFKDIFTGKVPTPANPRATSSQLCVRAGGKHNDLENVGYTRRHHTLFEMLGNFSFGDYFKEEAIEFAWEFVTEVIGLPKERLYVSVFRDDDEAYKLWERHIDRSHLARMDEKDNFWQMGDTGACGPCSEIYYDQGESFSSSEDYFGGEGDRFLEIWNLVFMQYDRDRSGKLNPLPKPSIDTGMGLERVQAILEGKLSNFESSLFMPIIHKTEEVIKKKYIYEEGASFRVIADHIRAVTHLLAQGVNFDKVGRGYVARRILRRAIRHGYLLGQKEPFMFEVSKSVVESMGEAYPYLKDKASSVETLIKYEEEAFFSTISEGMELFKKELSRTQGKHFSGEVAFKLYDTYGFPLDLTQDMLRDKEMGVELDEFEKLMSEQKDRSKANWKGSGDVAKEGDFEKLLEKFGVNEFVGYETNIIDAKILALLNGEFKEVDTLQEGEAGYMMLEKTPLYAESGGQRGDEGTIYEGDEVVALVSDTTKFFGLNISKVEPLKPLKRQNYRVEVGDKRAEIARHHSATHLLHYVLKDILGEHVAQAGSLVLEDRLRFDFSHPKALSIQEIELVEKKVNDIVLASTKAKVEERSIDDAKKMGAAALFGEKYGDVVRVVQIGPSLELCGGTHVQSSAEIGSFFIIKESGVSAGVRRIEAVCGRSAYEYAKSFINQSEQAKEVLKSQDLLGGIKKQKEQIKELKEQIKKLQSSSKKELSSKVINGIKVIVDREDDADIKSLIDEAKNQNEKVAIMLLQVKGEKVIIAAGAKNCPIKAGAWVKEIAQVLGGNGGGRDDFAQAGGKDTSKVDEATKVALEHATTILQ